MIKHIIAVIVTALAAWAMFLVYQSDKEVNKIEEIGTLIAKTQVKVNLGTTKPIAQESSPVVAQTDASVQKEREKKKKELDEKLQALKNKAGNAAAFKVSPLYRQKCASCHGVNGEGIIGPKLIGDTSEKVYQALTDFKSGKRKNYVMYGLLSKMDDEQLKQLSDEIGTFEQKLQEQQQ